MRGNPRTLPEKDGRCMRMKNRHTIITYALESVPRPGARESRVRRPPDGVAIRHERSWTDERKG